MFSYGKKWIFTKEFMGRGLRTSAGHFFGWMWVHSNGDSSRTSACIASCHPPTSITWTWAMYYHKPKKGWRLRPGFHKTYNGWHLTTPLMGSFSFSRQEPMNRKTA